MKIICIVQARMGSERLPKKVMRKIENIPMIQYTLMRLKKSKYVDDIILATSNKPEDDELADFVSSLGFTAFRGDEINVLKRYKDAAEENNGDLIIRVTGDCPFIDPLILDYTITAFLAGTDDYVRTDVPDSFIRGFDIEVFTKKTLDKVYELTKDFKDADPYKEHVTLFIYKNPEHFKIRKLTGDQMQKRNYRLCVDTIEDFELVTKIYEHFDDIFVHPKDIIQFLDDNPFLAKINEDIVQHKV